MPITRTCLKPARCRTPSAVTALSLRWCHLPPLVEAVEPRVADQVEAGGVGDDRRVLAVGERPDRPARGRVERVRRPLERREVDAPGDDRGRAGDRAVRLELPEDRAGRRVEREEPVRVRAREDAVAPDGGRRVDEAARRLRPAKLAARGAERVHLAVGGADVDPAVRDRRRAVEVPGVTEAPLRLRLPEDLPASGCRARTRGPSSRRRTAARPRSRRRSSPARAACAPSAACRSAA